MKARRLAVILLTPTVLLACTQQTDTSSDDGAVQESGGTGDEDGGSGEGEEGGEPASTVPNVPDAETARAELDALAVESEGPMTDYERELFPHWSEEGECSVRETVLARDGVDVVAGSDCYPTSGEWHSPYDGEVLDVAAEVDIDHMVPLAEAWRSGAAEWTTDRREEFANDLANPQLIATSATSNRSKGDQDPADWQPTVETYHCAYARMWIRSKHVWELSVDTDERTALEAMLDTC
ncbi:HNH endonuclease family protein [Streptomyces sp. 4N509B]|uniref:HNH endonuclease family protein n=1 Tax=Streptomyces sp. 4N509B TaxID=3457413 RepID=UPI003FD11DAB